VPILLAVLIRCAWERVRVSGLPFALKPISADRLYAIRAGAARH